MPAHRNHYSLHEHLIPDGSFLFVSKVLARGLFDFFHAFLADNLWLFAFTLLSIIVDIVLRRSRHCTISFRYSVLKYLSLGSNIATYTYLIHYMRKKCKWFR